MTVLDADASLAGVAGKLREIYYQHQEPVDGRDDFFSVGDRPTEVYQLGGNAVYRRSALNDAGSFNVGLISHEEAELAERLRGAGYRLIRLPQLAAVHHTAPRHSVAECWRRLRSGLQTGFGQVLRLTMGTPLFWAHARQLNRYLLCLAFLLLGVAAAIVSLLSRDVRYVACWLAVALALGLLFIAGRRRVRYSVEVLADWVFASPAIAWGFLQRPPRPRIDGNVSDIIEPFGASPTAPTDAC